jgi:hypothetical protein
LTAPLPRGKHHAYRADGLGINGGDPLQWIATTRALSPKRWLAE